MIDLTVGHISRCYFLNRRKLKKAVRFILRSFGIREARLSIYFASDDEVRRLNRLYRHSNRLTDVLAFSMREGLGVKGDPVYLGDVAISVDRARAQAGLYNSTFKREIYLYIVHGILHLLGYDDENESAKRRMHKEEKKILDLLWAKIDS